MCKANSNQCGKVTCSVIVVIEYCRGGFDDLWYCGKRGCVLSVIKSNRKGECFTLIVQILDLPLLCFAKHALLF